MKEEDKKEIKKLIDSKIKDKSDITELFQYLLNGYKQVIDIHMVMFVMSLINENYCALKEDFLLLRKNASENITLNKIHTLKALEDTKGCGAGFYEKVTMKKVMLASSRFGKDSLPIYMPQTEEVYKKYNITEEDIIEASKDKEVLRQLDDNI